VETPGGFPPPPKIEIKFFNIKMLKVITDWLFQTPLKKKLKWDKAPKDIIYIISQYLLFTNSKLFVLQLQNIRSLNTHWKRITDDITNIHLRNLSNIIFVNEMQNFIEHQTYRSIVYQKKLYKVNIQSFQTIGNPYKTQFYIKPLYADFTTFTTYINGSVKISFNYDKAAFKKHKCQYDNYATIIVKFSCDINHPMVKRYAESYFHKSIPIVSIWLEDDKKKSITGFRKAIADNIVNGLKYHMT
jgi:transcription-repair coupling factor (superfamily II helicase)